MTSDPSSELAEPRSSPSPSAPAEVYQETSDQVKAYLPLSRCRPGSLTATLAATNSTANSICHKKQYNINTNSTANTSHTKNNTISTSLGLTGPELTN